MRIIFFLLLFLCAFAPVTIAQTPQQRMQQATNELRKQIADQEKLIADAKKTKEDPGTIKEMEDHLTMLKNQLSLISNVSKSIASIPSKNLKQINDDPGDIPRFTKYNPAAIKALPTINSKAALTNYIADLHNHFLKKINPTLVASFKQIQSQLENDGENMASAAITAWYSEAPAQSVLLITKAAMDPKASDLTINNLAAILNMGGLELKAIPILNYLAVRHPENSMVLNNLGQAYAGTGDLEQAMTYLNRCLAIEPNHPQANNTVGEIELSRKNTEAASQHFKNSLNGAFNPDVVNHITSIDPDADISDYTKGPIFLQKQTTVNRGSNYLLTAAITQISSFSRNSFAEAASRDNITNSLGSVQGFWNPYMHIRMPEYFNEDKYNVPPQCQNVNDAESLIAIYRGYHDMLDNLHLKYDNLNKEYIQKTKNQMLRGNTKVPPFYVQAGYAWRALEKKYMSDQQWLMQVDIDYAKRKKEISDQYSSRQAGSDCAAMTAATNAYLRDMADATHDWQRKHMVINKKYINQFIYWSFFFSFSSDEFKMKFYGFVKDYLAEMRGIATTELIGPPCKATEQGNTPAQEIAIEEPHCPIDLEVKLIVGKIALNCERFSFGGGEIVKFKYEKNFTSKQSTLSLGVGATLELGGNFGGGFKGSAGVDFGENVFVTLDANNHFSDFGMNAKAEASVKVSKESSYNLGNSVAQEVTRSSDIFGADASVKCSAGINSGLTVSGSSSLSPGPLKALF